MSLDEMIGYELVEPTRLEAELAARAVVDSDDAEVLVPLVASTLAQYRVALARHAAALVPDAPPLDVDRPADSYALLAALVTASRRLVLERVGYVRPEAELVDASRLRGELVAIESAYESRTHELERVAAELTEREAELERLRRHYAGTLEALRSKLRSWAVRHRLRVELPAAWIDLDALERSIFAANGAAAR